MIIKNSKALIALLGLTLLTACGSTAQSADGLEDIETALIKNSNLESGTFETTLTLKSGEKEHKQRVEGAFIKRETEEYDWYRTVYHDSQDEDNFNTLVEIDGTQYVKYSQLDTVWEEAPEATLTLNGEIGPLLELDDYEVESVTTEEIDGDKFYYVTLDAGHGEQVKEDVVTALKKNIKILEESNASEDVIQNIESEIKTREQSTYSDFEYTYKIDEDGYLTTVEWQYKMLEPTDVEYEFLSSYTLTDYNLLDLIDLLPEVN